MAKSNDKYILPIGSGDLKKFRKNLEEARKGKKELKVRMKTEVSNFVEISFEDKDLK